jgi:hypothetical protein
MKGREWILFVLLEGSGRRSLICFLKILQNRGGVTRSASPQLLLCSLQHSLDVKSLKNLCRKYKIHYKFYCGCTNSFSVGEIIFVSTFQLVLAIQDWFVNGSWRRQHVFITLCTTSIAVILRRKLIAKYNKYS